MSTQITTAFVQQYRANVFHLSQQKGSRLRSAVRNEMQKGKSAFYDRIGSVSAVIKSSRHGNTPQLDTPHSRRMVTMADYEWADLIDNEDKIRTLIDPQNEYVQAAMWAMGRAMDDVLIAAALGNAATGETGTGSQALGAAQRVQALSGTSEGNLSVNAMIRAKQIIDSSDVDPSVARYFALNASALASLLQSTQVTSADYNSVKALVQGELDTFLGFKIIRTERLVAPSVAFTFDTATGLYNGSGSTSTIASAKSCIAWAQDGLLLSVGQDMEAKISERADKSYSTQVYARMGIGGVRMEEAKVVEVLCYQP